MSPFWAVTQSPFHPMLTPAPSPRTSPIHKGVTVPPIDTWSPSPALRESLPPLENPTVSRLSPPKAPSRPRRNPVPGRGCRTGVKAAGAGGLIPFAVCSIPSGGAESPGVALTGGATRWPASPVASCGRGAAPSLESLATAGGGEGMVARFAKAFLMVEQSPSIDCEESAVPSTMSYDSSSFRSMVYTCPARALIQAVMGAVVRMRV
jgi:hypothetical protein